MTLKEQIADLSRQAREIEKQVALLRQQCPHPEFIEGLSMTGCVQSVLICTECGDAKPIPPHDMGMIIGC